jgi:hypothetical protein
MNMGVVLSSCCMVFIGATIIAAFEDRAALLSGSVVGVVFPILAFRVGRRTPAGCQEINTL